MQPEPVQPGPGQPGLGHVAEAPGSAVTYASAGVDIDAADRAVELMKASVARASRPEVIGSLGGFAGLFDASALRDYRRPVLATSTDGVGTKVEIARRMDVHDTIGRDLIGMVVDDLVVVGAQPLFVTDYIACGRLVPERVAAIVAGVAEGCRLAGAALVGGETAEHPGLMEPDEYDLAGATTGVVEAAEMLGPHRVRAGDVLVAMASSGLHSNGYSLARHVLLERAGWSLEREVPELGRTLGEELLEPTRIYAKDCLDLVRALGGGQAGEVHAFSHVTGGGVAANLARVLPRGVQAVLHRDTWTPPPIFGLVGELGGVARDDVEAALNMGIGMIAVLTPGCAREAVDLLQTRGVPAWVAGAIEVADQAGDEGEAGSGTAALVGDYRG